MAELVELSATEHGKLKVSPNNAGLLAKQLQIININASEVAQAATDLPVFMTKSETTGGWGMCVLTSLEQGKAPLVKDDQWQSMFMPSQLSTYPVLPMRKANSEQYTLGIEPESLALSSETGEALFNDDGSETIYLENLRRQIDGDIKAGYQTHLLTQEADKLGLMKRVDLVLLYKDGTKQNLKGLYTFDEEKLQSLASEQLHQLHSKGFLLAIHAVLISTLQLNRLIRLHNEMTDGDKIINVKIALDQP